VSHGPPLLAGRELVVSVKDDGIGISPAMLRRVFDIFAQDAAARQRSQSGLGIGLSLVKGLVELHGGSIAAHSDGPGRGSEFVVRLPVVLDQPAAAPPAADGKTGPPCVGKCCILVVDNVQANADILAELLDVMGQEVRTAYGGEEAVRTAAEFRPQVVLLDVGMPEVDGYEAARRIRRQPWGKDMLVVALTGWAGEEDRRKTREAGFDEHLVKPVGSAALLQLLSRLPRGVG
jgi:CheY-like chemotaxis protein